jgi:hypothetical protein
MKISKPFIKNSVSVLPRTRLSTQSTHSYTHAVKFYSIDFQDFTEIPRTLIWLGPSSRHWEILWEVTYISPTSAYKFVYSLGTL